MGMLSSFVGVLVLLILIQAKGQPGFISIDCGAEAGVNYTDSVYGINYVSDADFINTGVSQTIASEELKRRSSQRQLWRLRSFPEGKRNCYKISVTGGSKYLIRTTFLYGNYDGRNMLPEFDLLLGPNSWDTVTIFNASRFQSYEIIHVPSLDFVQICLVNTGNGTPFITAIEFRTLKNEAYVTQFGSLELYKNWRCDLGSDMIYRYSYDAYDRFWVLCDFKEDWTRINASIPDDSLNQTEEPPAIVMSTAVTPANDSAPLVISWKPEHETDQFYVYMHFKELQVLTTNQTREFNIMLNAAESWFSNCSPRNYRTIYSTSARSGKELKFSLERTEKSTLPPIINAIEIYRVIDLQKPETFQEDVDAITTIKSVYALKNDWQGDPCAPLAYLWDGLNCSYHANDSLRITTLNLSSSGLSGKIDPSISNLTMLEKL
ncbi:hypothetical protein LR48_Vigan05g206500 [Vigna angularis]|uniref:Malectin-like domain-containing protein n=2 Tax=Phaseolus angularis TaxID=3914 RepID=A0A0L9UNL3_PHAAN|nr:hypothetical protein LR48_Vigan05g206500 [Vigna angularis]